MRERFRFLVALCSVSVGAAGFAIAFRSLLAVWYRSIFHANDVVQAIGTLPWWLRLSVPACGGAMAGILSALCGRGHGVSNVMEAVVLGNVRLSLRSTLCRVASSWAAIAAGMSIGREGPLIEFGGTLGARAGRILTAPLDRTRVLIASGTAAGFAAAYNTPFAAVLFVLETIVGVATPVVLLPAIASTVIATAITRSIVGAGPIYGQRAFSTQSSSDLIAFGGLAILAGFAAFAFKQMLAWTEELFERYPMPRIARAALGGISVGAIAVWLPDVAGNGYEPLNALLDQQLHVGVAAMLLVAKVAATSGSVGSGVPGGIFTPMLLVGAALGTIWASCIGSIMPWANTPAGSYALVGMAATTAASIHAPLTAAVLVFELSGDYPIVLPLLLATFLSTSVSKLLGSQSVYDAELRRRGLGWELTLEGRRVIGS
jgi:chloride channel protein, CIC family